MLEREDGRYITFYCDGCSDFIETDESDFSAANEIRKAMDWDCFQDSNNEWCHYCPACREKMDGRA